jgi:hypothetical protein
MVTLTGGNTRMARGKDMEHGRVLMETDTLGYTLMMSSTAMEYSDGLMEKYIMENGNRIIKKAKDITSGRMAMNIAENGRMTRDGEREYTKKMDNYTEINMKQAIPSAGVKYRKVLEVE